MGTLKSLSLCISFPSFFLPRLFVCVLPVPTIVPCPSFCSQSSILLAKATQPREHGVRQNKGQFLRGCLFQGNASEVDIQSQFFEKDYIPPPGATNMHQNVSPVLITTPAWGVVSGRFEMSQPFKQLLSSPGHWKFLTRVLQKLTLTVSASSLAALVERQSCGAPTPFPGTSQFSMFVHLKPSKYKKQKLIELKGKNGQIYQIKNSQGSRRN